MSNLEEIVQALLRANKIVLAGHIAPDGDCVGSVLAMGLTLRELGKEVFMISSDPIPQTFNFLPGYNNYLSVNDFPANFDLALLLDSTDLHRCGEDLSLLLKTAPIIVNIDHHVSNQEYGQFNYVDPKAAATGEIVYELVAKLGVKINADIATCIYTALVMDTGSFMYDNTSEKSHHIAADLIEAGVAVSSVNIRLFEEKPYVSMKLLGEALKSLEMSKCKQVAWMSITKETMVRLGATEEHTDGIINYPKMIEGVEVGLLFREIETDKVKVGFRSKGLVDVNKVANQFNGGGHPRAAGAIIVGDLDQIKNNVVEAVLKAFPE